MFTIDVTKNQLSKAINDQQRNLNNSNTHRLKQHKTDFIEEKSNMLRSRNSTEHMVYIHKNLADIQKEQMELRKIDAANDLIKSRIQDEQNLLKVQQKYPFGKQNVNISQDVLERYKGNYIQQSRILQKFRMEAELMKKTSRVKGSQGKPFQQWVYRQNVVDNKKKQEQLKKMRLILQNRQQQQRLMRLKQKQGMRKIAETLSGLSLLIHNNSYTLQKGIRQLHNRLKKNQKKLLDFPRRIHAYKDILDLQASNSKIPIIVYKNEPLDARLYFSDVYKNTQKIKKQIKSNGQSEQYGKIVKILSQNNRRLNYLDKLSAFEKQN